MFSFNEWVLIWLGVAIVAQIIVFFALREFFLWYWKVDRAVHLLSKIHDQLARIEEQGRAMPAGISNGDNLEFGLKYPRLHTRAR